MESFTITIADAVLDDLKERLRRARFPSDLGNCNWDYGTNAAYVRLLVDYWQNQYDWRAAEREMNAYPHFRTEIDGNPIHFIHVRGKGPNPIPIMLNHGWPWTFWDLRKLIGPLTDPAAYGGDPAHSFDVIVPSLPGFGFSTPLQRTGVDFCKTADMWVELMTRLGYDRFATYGGDWGAIISTQLGHKYADRLIGIHLSLTLPLDFFSVPLPGAELYGPEEAGWYEKSQHFFQTKSGYSAIQATQPQTLAFGLEDSPVGQLAWLLEKRRSWSDCGGEVETVFSKDDLLTIATLYWVTQSGGSSARYYYEGAHNPWVPSHGGTPVVSAPTTTSLFINDVLMMPRKWAEGYYNLKSYKTYPHGGHFAPFEQPDIMVADLRAAFYPAA